MKEKLKRILVRNAINQISVSQCSVANSQIVSKGGYILENGTRVLNENMSFSILHTSLFRRLPNIQFIDAIIRKATSVHYILFSYLSKERS